MTIIFECSTSFQDAFLRHSSESPSDWSLSYSLCKDFRISCLAFQKDFPLSSLLCSLIFLKISFSPFEVFYRVYFSFLFSSFLCRLNYLCPFFLSSPWTIRKFLPSSSTLVFAPFRIFLWPLHGGSLYCFFWTESNALLHVNLPPSFCKPENDPSYFVFHPRTSLTLHSPVVSIFTS